MESGKDKQKENTDGMDQAASKVPAEPSVDAGSPDPAEVDTTDTAGELQAIKDECNAHKDKYLRLMAEFDNYKRRTSREYESVRELATEKLMVDLLEIKENFDRALIAGKEKPDAEAFFKGMQLIDEKLAAVMQKHGCASFTEIGDPFDPAMHDALMKQPHDEIPDDHIAGIFEKGYTLRGRVIKHGRVIVSGGKPEAVTTKGASDGQCE